MTNKKVLQTIPASSFCGQEPRTEASAETIAGLVDIFRKEFEEKLVESRRENQAKIAALERSRGDNRARISALERSRGDNRAKIAALEQGRADIRARLADLEKWRDAVEADRDGSRRLDIYDFL